MTDEGKCGARSGGKVLWVCADAARVRSGVSAERGQPAQAPPKSGGTIGLPLSFPPPLTTQSPSPKHFKLRNTHTTARQHG